MTDGPVDLDKHRGMDAQKSTEIRRRLQLVQEDQAALRQRQDEFESFLLSAPATTWVEVASKARYLLQLLVPMLEAQDSRRQRLVASTLEDLTRLSDCTKEDP